MCSPGLAQVPAHAMPADAGAPHHIAFLQIKRGTSDGRVAYPFEPISDYTLRKARAGRHVQARRTWERT